MGVSARHYNYIDAVHVFLLIVSIKIAIRDKDAEGVAGSDHTYTDTTRIGSAESVETLRYVQRLATQEASRPYLL